MALILITGADGFIGRHLVARLVADGHAVRALVRRSADFGPGIDVRIGDMARAQEVGDAVQGADCVVNCAAKVSDWGPTPQFEATNVGGVRNLIAAAQCARPHRPHIVQLSSADVYGFPNRSVDEDHPVRPIGIPYVDTKIAAEALLNDASRSGLPVTVLRPTNVIGPGSKTYIDELLDAARSLRFVPDIAPAQAYGGLLCIANLVEAITAVACNPAAFGQTYTVCDEMPVRWTQYIEDLTAMAALSLPVVKLPFRILYIMASSAERVAGFYKSAQRPPLTRLAVQIIGTDQNFTAAKLRALPGYRPVATYRDTMADIARSLAPVPAGHATSGG